MKNSRKGTSRVIKTPMLREEDVPTEAQCRQPLAKFRLKRHWISPVYRITGVDPMRAFDQLLETWSHLNEDDRRKALMEKPCRVFRYHVPGAVERLTGQKMRPLRAVPTPGFGDIKGGDENGTLVLAPELVDGNQDLFELAIGRELPQAVIARTTLVRRLEIATAARLSREMDEDYYRTRAALFGLPSRPLQRPRLPDYTFAHRLILGLPSGSVRCDFVGYVQPSAARNRRVMKIELKAEIPWSKAPVRKRELQLAMVRHMTWLCYLMGVEPGPVTNLQGSKVLQETRMNSSQRFALLLLARAPFRRSQIRRYAEKQLGKVPTRFDKVLTGLARTGLVREEFDRVGRVYVIGLRKNRGQTATAPRRAP
jgi:hypothetical protein